jgi:sporulation protein YlmC with PRC-barrel domain
MPEITSDDILGKDVLDPHGDMIGVVQQLRIDKGSKNITGIVVDQGFMKPDLFIGLDFVENFGIDSIFLNKLPIPKLKGFDVYDKKGKKIGYIADIEEKDGNPVALKVKRNVFSKPVSISTKLVKTVGFSVVLNVEESQIVKK